jgi:hypothetical protein
MPNLSRAAALVSPAEGVALIATRRAATSPPAIEAREFWILVRDARRAFREGRSKAGYKGLEAIRFRLARAAALRARAHVRRLASAEADLEARARAALAPEDAA